MKKLYKSLAIGVGALVISTVAIQASDLVRGIEGNMSGLAIDSTYGPCGKDAMQMLFGSNSICVDKFEASPSASCPSAQVTSQLDTQQNFNEAECKPESKELAMPWSYVSFTQAQQLCARAGKRLPINEEWYRAASGLDSQNCAIKTGGQTAIETGSVECVTPAGIHDMVGNVWEWIDEEVVEGSFNNRTLPETGYVTSVDTNGVVVETANTGSDEYGKDYAWTGASGVKGVIRGGFYGSGDDAGIFAQNLSVSLDFKTAGVGFRCVRDI